MKPTIITLTGPSCAGKTTLERLLNDRGVVALRSTTTRSPRAGEVDGKDYNFVTEVQFKEMIARKEFIEWVHFANNYYAVEIKVVNVATEKNQPAVLICEPGGRDQIVAFCKRHGWEVHTVWVDNPPEIIAERFLNRMTEEIAENARLYRPVEPLVRRYTQRMVTMTTIEEGWRREARGQVCNYHPYTRLFWKFDDTNAVDIVNGICKLVTKEFIQKAA